MAESEQFKGGVHALAASLAATLLVYNAMRLSEEHDWRHVLNVSVYLPLTIFEWMQVKGHWSQHD